jgi:hypothetical protein
LLTIFIYLDFIRIFIIYSINTIKSVIFEINFLSLNFNYIQSCEQLINKLLPEFCTQIAIYEV